MKEFAIKYKDEKVEVVEMTSEEFYQKFRAHEGINLAVFDGQGRMIFGTHVDDIICDFCNRRIPRSDETKVYLIGSYLLCVDCFEEWKKKGGAR